VDFSKFICPFYNQHVLAWQFYYEAAFSKNEIPFQLLPTLGGRDLMRGFRQGMYRDNVMMMLQTEYRIPVYKRIKVAVFLSAGDVMNSSTYHIDKLKVAYGAGLRCRLNDARVHLRVDIAKNNYGDKLQFYITATEAFLTQSKNSMRGLVIKNTGSWYQVKNTETGETTECKIKGNLRLKDIRSTNPIAVGDFVQYLLNDDGTGMISDIDDRRNYIVRRSSNLSKQSHILATNLDLVVLVATINYPITSTTFIDRFLASAEAYRVPACIVINKVDLYTKEEIEYLEAIKYLYESLNYPVFAISAKNSQDITEVTNFLKAKTALFSGNSGVGKSTLINAIAVRPIAKTGEISSYHNKGMHTTTFSEMFELSNGARIIDTPGIKGFGSVDMEAGETKSLL